MPNEFTWEDDEKFKQKLKAQIALCFVFCLVCDFGSLYCPFSFLVPNVNGT